MRSGVRWHRIESAQMKKGNSGGALNYMGTETYTARITNPGHDTGMRFPGKEIEGIFGRKPIIGQRLEQSPEGVVKIDSTYRWSYSRP